MNLRNSLLSCLLSLCALPTTAQSWSGTNPLYTNSNVGIGFAGSLAPNLNEKLTVRGSIIIDVGALKFSGLGQIVPYEIPDSDTTILTMTGESVRGAFDPKIYRLQAKSIALRGGDASEVVGPPAIGGTVYIQAGSSNNSAVGGNVNIDAGTGSVSGNIIMQSSQGSKGNVGIGIVSPLSKLHVKGNSILDGNLFLSSSVPIKNTDKLFVDGSIRVNYGGYITYKSSSDQPSTFFISGSDVSGVLTVNDDPAGANSVTIKGGDAFGISGNTGVGGALYLYGGASNSSAAGSHVYIEAGSGSKSGDIIMQAYQGGGGSVLIGVKERVGTNNFCVGGSSFFKDYVTIGTPNPKPLSILEVGKASKTYFIDEAAQIGIGWNAYKEGATWKYSNASTPVSRLGQFENGFNLSIAKTGSIGSIVTWSNVLQATYTSNILETRIGNKDSQTFMDGYVSIGGILSAKMPAGYSLAVAKGILTEKVKIATVASAEWKDFVFDEGYKLRSLQELESFINDHKHLPEVPSSSDVEQNGYELVKMDATLLQKLEELTLYVIELQKRIKILEEGK